MSPTSAPYPKSVMYSGSKATLDSDSKLFVTLGSLIQRGVRTRRLTLNGNTRLSSHSPTTITNQRPFGTQGQVLGPEAGASRDGAGMRQIAGMRECARSQGCDATELSLMMTLPSVVRERRVANVGRVPGVEHVSLGAHRRLARRVVGHRSVDATLRRRTWRKCKSERHR